MTALGEYNVAIPPAICRDAADLTQLNNWIRLFMQANSALIVRVGMLAVGGYALAVKLTAP